MDHVNALLQLGAVGFVCLSIRRVLQDRGTRGLSLWQVGYFCAWGAFNLAYYPTLGQVWSTAAGVALFTANATYLSLCLWFKR